MTISFRNTIINTKDIPEKTPEIETQSSGYLEPITWGCNIPYVIDKSIVFPDSVTKAIEYVSTVTDYSFVSRTDETNYILFKDGDGCHTTKGKGHNQLQSVIKPVVIIVLSEHCDMYAIVHEIGHVLGLSHTMQRQDRDDYITVNTDNIIDDKRAQYEKNNVLTIGDFDIDSTMMYDRYSFVKDNRIPITTSKVAVNSKIGGRKGFSIGDVKNINNKAYSNNCKPKSKAPPCNTTDIEFFDGDTINSYFGQNGYYYKVSDEMYEGYNLYSGKRYKIQKNQKNWKISHDDNVYAYSVDADLFTNKGWNILSALDNKIVLVPEARVKTRNCEWPDLAGYHEDVPFNLLNFFYTHSAIIIGIIAGILLLMGIYLLKTEFVERQLNNALALMMIPLSLLKRTTRLVRSKSISLYKGITNSIPRRATI